MNPERKTDRLVIRTSLYCIQVKSDQNVENSGRDSAELTTDVERVAPRGQGQAADEGVVELDVVAVNRDVVQNRVNQREPVEELVRDFDVFDAKESERRSGKRISLLFGTKFEGKQVVVVVQELEERFKLFRLFCLRQRVSDVLTNSELGCF